MVGPAVVDSIGRLLRVSAEPGFQRDKAPEVRDRYMRALRLSFGLFGGDRFYPGLSWQLRKRPSTVTVEVEFGWMFGGLTYPSRVVATRFTNAKPGHDEPLVAERWTAEYGDYRFFDTDASDDVTTADNR